MATPIYSDVIEQINTYIIANGNNEITANVLNPILTLITDFANNTIGDLSTLTTDESENIVAALNSLKENINSISDNGVKLFTGFDDPNTTPPSSYNYADFYMQIDVDDNSPILLYQWDGFIWKTSGVEDIYEAGQYVRETGQWIKLEDSEAIKDFKNPDAVLKNGEITFDGLNILIAEDADRKSVV